ncbi:MAG: hypothetical protein NVSMB9_14020 [Isosphaeraceae bacterium]
MMRSSLPRVILGWIGLGLLVGLSGESVADEPGDGTAIRGASAAMGGGRIAPASGHLRLEPAAEERPPSLAARPKKTPGAATLSANRAALPGLPSQGAHPGVALREAVSASGPAQTQGGPLDDSFIQTIRWDLPVFSRPRAPTATGGGKTSDWKDDPSVGRADFLNDTSAVNPPPEVKASPSFVDTYFNRPERMLEYWLNDSTFFRLEGLFRGYYRNDQRIRWSGVEETFGAEGDLRPSLWNRHGNWTVSAEGEFFLNMPYGGTSFGGAILSTHQTDPYRQNFQVNTFEIFQLYTQASWGNWRFRLGKTRTPFGNFRVPMYSNSLFDAPFVRTDVIPFTETGAFGRYQRDWFSCDFALVNGEPNLDTNSSKGFIGRLGVDRPYWSLGISDKTQDGVGSELQKRRNSIQAVDASVRYDRFVAYGEVVRDEYGFNHDFNRYHFIPPGVRSLYGRDIYVPGGLTGWGWYTGVGYRGVRFLADLNYGVYQPQHIGDPIQDAAIVRSVAKIDFALTPHLHLFALGLIENRRTREGILDAYHPWAFQTGIQFVF